MLTSRESLRLVRRPGCRRDSPIADSAHGCLNCRGPPNPLGRADRQPGPFCHLHRSHPTWRVYPIRVLRMVKSVELRGLATICFQVRGKGETENMHNVRESRASTAEARISC
jgi:hypothetical protein